MPARQTVDGRPSQQGTIRYRGMYVGRMSSAGSVMPWWPTVLARRGSLESGEESIANIPMVA